MSERRLFREAEVDFFDLHAYPSPADPTLAQLHENFGAVGYQEKPLVLGEFGAFTSLYPDVYTPVVVPNPNLASGH